MAYKLEIRHLATMEVLEAFDWYESQREGLGIEFLNELENLNNSILRNPTNFSYYDKPVRQ